MIQNYKDPLLIYGVGSQALIVLECLQKSVEHCIFVNDFDIGDNFQAMSNNCKAIGQKAITEWLASEKRSLKCIVPIGNSFGDIRLEKQKLLTSFGHQPLNVLHPTSTQLGGSEWGSGVQLLAHSLLGVNSQLGEAVVLNSACSVDHDCILDDGCHVGPNATLTGRVKLGKNVFVGAGATIVPDTQVCSNVIIGAGSVVLNHISESGTYAGVPAKKIAD